MQILEDSIEDYGDLAKRIAALHEQVKVLLEQKQEIVAQQSAMPSREVIVESPVNEKLVQENKLLKLQLEEKNSKLPANEGLELRILQKQIEDQKLKISELQNSSSSVSGSSDDDLVQENNFLKKQLEDKEKTIKELGFKLEMLKMAKNLRSGALVNEKSEELKKIINEYIKELDKNIASLNIK